MLRIKKVGHNMAVYKYPTNQISTSFLCHQSAVTCECISTQINLKMEYTRFSGYEREPYAEYSTQRPMMMANYPSGHREFTEKVVYEDSVIGEPRHHHMHHHHHPETREVVKVVEYEVPERRIGEVMYEENKVAYNTAPYLPRY